MYIKYFIIIIGFSLINWSVWLSNYKSSASQIYYTNLNSSSFTLNNYYNLLFLLFLFILEWHRQLVLNVS